jgi:hypothetical protein
MPWVEVVQAVRLFLLRNDTKGLAKQIRNRISGVKRGTSFIGYPLLALDVAKVCLANGKPATPKNWSSSASALMIGRPYHHMKLTGGLFRKRTSGYQLSGRG